MAQEDTVQFYHRRKMQELAASDRATDPTIRRLHWEMAQRYAFLASEAEGSGEVQSEAEETLIVRSGETAF